MSSRSRMFSGWLSIAAVASVAAPSSADPSAGPEAKGWRVEDFDAVLFVGLEGYRDFENGRRAFAAALCAKCHRCDGAGPADGVDLAKAGERLGPREMLETLLSPAHPVDREAAMKRHGVEKRPGGFADGLDEEDVLDLLAYVLSGADPDDAMFAK